MAWALIDDMTDEAAALARVLTDGEFDVDVLKGGKALEHLSAAAFCWDGVLMDIDLQNESGFTQDGLSLAQLINTEQTRGKLSSFPIVRFSHERKVEEFVGTDSSSDDLFDWALNKEAVEHPDDLPFFRSTLLGLQNIYNTIDREIVLSEAVGLTVDQLGTYGHSSFSRGYETLDKAHLRARLVARLLMVPGILIDENLLALRLGIDQATSSGWPQLLDALTDSHYGGVACDFVSRWWARSVELWWEEELKPDDPLNSLNVAERHSLLSKRFADLSPLPLSEESPGDRPWRFCSLAQQETGALLPVDPEFGVPMRPRRPNEGWEDPIYASLGKASQNEGDARLDMGTLERLSKQFES